MTEVISKLALKMSQLKGRSPLEVLTLARQVAAAKWSLRKATSVGNHTRLIGRLVVVNKGQMNVGTKVFFHSQFAHTILVVNRGAELIIGDQAYINYGADISAHKSIKIGERCRIGTHCIIMDSDFHHIELEKRDERPPAAEVIIEPDVWIGNRVTILKGVHIGHGSVIAAGSVVTKSIPPMSIAGGVPAKVIRPIQGAQEVSSTNRGADSNELDIDLLLRAVAPITSA